MNGLLLNQFFFISCKLYRQVLIYSKKQLSCLVLIYSKNQTLKEQLSWQVLIYSTFLYSSKGRKI